jgi:hypothetical protein
MLAGAAGAATDEEGRAALRAHKARLAAERAIHKARLAAMKQRLPLMTALLQELWQCVGGARRSALTKVQLGATPAVEKRLEKAATDTWGDAIGVNRHGCCGNPALGEAGQELEARRLMRSTGRLYY